MSLPSEDSFSKYFPESELVELIECADDLPGGLGSRRNNQAPKTPAEQTPSPRGLKRPAPASEHSQSTSLGLNSRDNDIYAPSTYGGFGQYMRNKRAKLQVQNRAIAADADKNKDKSEIFKGVSIYASSGNRHWVLTDLFSGKRVHKAVYPGTTCHDIGAWRYLPAIS
jgi:hypothetical protein